ncbi:hypothetical protein [Streptomyces abikoensis]
MLTRPAPSLLRPAPDPPDARLRTETDRVATPVPPFTERVSRPDTDRRDPDDRDDGRDDEPDDEPDDEREDPDEPDEPDDFDEPDDPEPPEPPRPPAWVIPVAGEAICPPGDTTGARPHVSQYSSPSPTSS